jgi:hypothetical protein
MISVRDPSANSAVMLLPEDPEAEVQVIARAVAVDRGYRQAVENGVRAEHFYVVAHARLFAACRGLPTDWYDHVDPLVMFGPRPRAAAEAAGWTVGQVLDLDDQRGAGWDRTGKWAARLIDAWDRRQAMAALAAAYNALGQGERLDAALGPVFALAC